MNRLIKIFVIAILTTILLCGEVWAAEPKVIVDGDELSFDVPPVIENGRTLVPLRAIFEALGAEVHYYEDPKIIIAIKGTDEVVLRIGETKAKVNGRSKYLETPPIVNDGRTLVPLRFVGEALGAKVTWIEQFQTIMIHSKELNSVITPQNNNTIKRDFKWKYGFLRQWSWSLNIDRSLYEYYQGLPRAGDSRDYSIYVSDPYDDFYMADLVKQFKETKAENHFNDRQLVDFILAFVQSFPYVTDKDSTGYDEYPKYPLETLVDQDGDCEDTAILLASIYRQLGYDCVLLLLPGHMAVGIKGADDIPGTYYDVDGKKYYYIETTGRGWKIGEMPDEYKKEKATILYLNPRVIINHSWSSYPNAHGIDVVVTVNNEGSGKSPDTKVLVYYKDVNGSVCNQVLSDPYFFMASSSHTYVISLGEPPPGKYRIFVKVIRNSSTLSESESVWLGY